MDNALELLDEVERQIEDHRSRAIALAAESSQLMATLNEVKRSLPEEGLSQADREDLLATVDRLERRAGTVTVEGATARDEAQEQALAKMEALVYELVAAIEQGMPDAASTLQR